MNTLRSLRALVWLRWHLLKNNLTGVRRRDSLEQLSRALAVIVPLLVAVLSVGTFIAVSVVGFLGGRAVATGLLDAPVGIFIARLVIGLMAIMVVILTVVAPAQSALSRYTRLLLLPIERGALHLIEVVSGLFDPWIAVIGAGLAMFAVGLLAGGRPMAAGVAVLAAMGVVAVLATLAALVSFLVGWLMRSRRRGETFTLVFVLVVSILSFIPAFASKSFDSQRAGGGPRVRRQINIEQVNRRLPAWSRVLPSELYGQTINAGLRREPGQAAIGLIALLLEAAVLFGISARVHRQLLGSLDGDQGRRRVGALKWSAMRLPFIGAGSSAVAWALWRGALRTVRGRLTILLPGPMLAMLVMLFRGMPDERFTAAAAEQGYILFGTGLVLSFYSAHAFSMNLFGSDRAGLTLQFLSPLGDRDIAWGKIAGFGMIIGLAAALCLMASLAVARTGPPAYWIAALLGGVAMFFLISPIAIWMSALFPVASDLSRTGAAGNPHALPMLAGAFVTLLLAAPTAAIILAAEFWFRREAMAVPLSLVWLAGAVLLGVPLINAASRTIGARRENLGLVAQGR